MNDDIFSKIEDEFGNCLSAEELALKYTEIYIFLREQLHFCMDALTSGDEA